MVTITRNQQFVANLTPTDSRGNPATLDNTDFTPRWASSDESVATVEADPNDFTKALVVARGIGVAQITVEADADLDPGEQRVLPASIDVEVVPAEAVLLTIGAGEVVEQPPAE